MALTQSQWNKIQKSVPPEDRETYAQYLASLAQPTEKSVTPPATTGSKTDSAASAASAGAVPNFTPSPKLPEPAFQPGEPGFVGPQATEPATALIYDNHGNLVEVYTEGPNAGRDVETGGLVLQGEAPEGTIPGVPGSRPVSPGPAIVTQNPDGTLTGGSKPGYEDAFQRLYDEFKKIGLEALVTDGKDLLMKATSVDAMPDALRETRAYTDRFSANADRVKAGLKALDPAAYLNLEDKYQNVMREYGLPESYYKTGLYGKQEGFDKLIANDVSNVELEDRIATAQQRVLNSNPEVLTALKKFYPDLNNADILAYTLDPKNALENIKRKVTAAEIGGAALQQGLQALGGTAESLAGQGVTKAQAQAGFANVAEMAPRGSQLADIYGESPYTQQTAEAEVFNTAGAADAAKKRKKLTSLETAQFGGSSGVGALGRDRASYGQAYGQSGQF